METVHRAKRPPRPWVPPPTTEPESENEGYRASLEVGSMAHDIASDSSSGDESESSPAVVRSNTEVMSSPDHCEGDLESNDELSACHSAAGTTEMSQNAIRGERPRIRGSTSSASMIPRPKKNYQRQRSYTKAREKAQTPNSDRERLGILTDLIMASGPQLQHLATKPSYEHMSSTQNKTYNRRNFTPDSEQRHPGKPGVRLSRHSRPFEPEILEEYDPVSGSMGRASELPSSYLPETSTESDVSSENWLHGPPLIFLIVGLCFVIFLMSIDRTIITTAIPFITAEFHSTKDIGWYGSSYLLTACAFQPVFGRVYMLFDIKWSYLLSMFLFELGSLVCALSPSSAALIIGRAIAGFGSAGILTGSFVIVATAVPLQARPLYTAVVGLMFGVGATVGPLIGGLFTDLITWRWCFWINIPVGTANIIVMMLVFRSTPHIHMKRTVIDRLIDLDLVGNVLLLGASVMLFLALEFTTMGYSWGSVSVISLLVAFGITTALFITWQWWKQDGALIPPSIITQRTVAASCAAAFCTYGALLIHSYFLPLWFQAILGYSAIFSGLAMVPYCVANALFSLIGGIFVTVIGYFAPPAILGSIIGAIGCGIITTFYPQMSTAMWVGFEVLASAGFGMMIQQGFTAVQTVINPDEIAIGTAAVVAAQSLGGAIFISIGNNVFQSELKRLLSELPIPDLHPQEIIDAGAIAFRHMFDAEELELLIPAYNEALAKVFMVAVPIACLGFLACCFMEWRSVRKPQDMSSGSDTMTAAGKSKSSLRNSGTTETWSDVRSEKQRASAVETV